MKKTGILLFLFILFSDKVFSQQLPWGWCGIVNVYDGAGNRTKRVYFCQNGDPYPQKGNLLITEKQTENKTTEQFQPVDALYPNPTTGKVYITFSQSLSDASMTIIDNTGKGLQQFKASGKTATFDLSIYANGVYYIRIEENSKTITKKVIKQ